MSEFNLLLNQHKIQLISLKRVVSGIMNINKRQLSISSYLYSEIRSRIKRKAFRYFRIDKNII